MDDSQPDIAVIEAICDDAAAAFEEGKVRRARELYKKVLELDSGIMNHEDRIAVREYLGMCCYHLKRYGEAERLDRETLELLEQQTSYQADGEQAIRIRHNLARDLSAMHDHSPGDLNKLDAAVALHRGNLALLERSYKSKEDLRECRYSLAFDLSKLAKASKDKVKATKLWEEAACLGKSLLDSISSTGKVDGLWMLEAKHNYASSLFQLARYHEAKALFLESEKSLELLHATEDDKLNVLLSNTRRCLEACNEATMDLGLSLSRRSTGLGTAGDGDESVQGNVPNPRRPSIKTTAPDAHETRSESHIRTSSDGLKVDERQHRSSQRPGAYLRVPNQERHSVRKLKSDERLGRDMSSEHRRSRSASDAGPASQKPNYGVSASPSGKDSGGKFFRAFPDGHDADRWFHELWKNAHSVLSYDDVKVHRQRVRVAILDSGLERPFDKSKQRQDIRRHRNRLKAYKDVSNGQDWADSSPDLHGTNCASLLLQVAPEADLYVASVTRDGSPDPNLVGEALDWALSNEVDIISMSLGFDTVHDRISDLIDLARQKRTLVFAAASNDGDFDQAHGVFPAWLPTVFCIRSTKAIGAPSDFNPQLTSEKANFMFLGEDIAIAGLSGLGRLSGNSFATPIAAGTAALVLDLTRVVRDANEQHPRVEKLLKSYEGMSAIFKAMSGDASPGRYYYHVRPWQLLCEHDYTFPLQDGVPSASKEWIAFREVAEKLVKRFGKIWGRD